VSTGHEIDPDRIKYYLQAAENNKGPILEHLKVLFGDKATILEIGSGSGQHAIYFASSLPHLKWQPTDRGDYFDALVSNLIEYAPDNLLEPVYLDVSAEIWPVSEVDHIFSANVLHIASVENVQAFFRGAGSVIRHDGLLCLYGPFKYAGEFTTESNREFDLWLKSRDQQSGIRDFEWICELADTNGFSPVHDFPMPANNQLIVFRKTDHQGVKSAQTRMALT